MFDHNETLEQARQRNISDALREDIGQQYPKIRGDLVDAHPVQFQRGLLTSAESHPFKCFHAIGIAP